MKKGLKIVIAVVAACILGMAVFAIFSLNAERHRELACSGLKVEFADKFNFVTAEDIEGYLNKEYGAYIGQRLDSVDLMKVETILGMKSAILRAEAFTTPDGKLNVKIYQREPSVRFQTFTKPPPGTTRINGLLSASGLPDGNQTTLTPRRSSFCAHSSSLYSG